MVNVIFFVGLTFSVYMYVFTTNNYYCCLYSVISELLNILLKHCTGWEPVCVCLFVSVCVCGSSSPLTAIQD